MDQSTAYALGIAAHKAGKQRAPILHREIADAVRGMAVGDGASAIFNAYSNGWDSEQRKADASAAIGRVHAAAAR